MSLPKYKQVAAIVRDQIADGMLPPGASAPSGAALARLTGYSNLTCRRALQTLVQDGTLAPGASRNARPRVPAPDHCGRTLDDAKRELCTALAGFRHAAGLTQPQLAKLTGDSLTAIGHAETGRLWQAPDFWERVDKALDADGELLRLYDAHRAAEVAPVAATAAEDTEPVPATVAADTALDSADTTEPQPAADEPPVPAILLIVWTDGAIAAVPMTRETKCSLASPAHDESTSSR